MPGDHWWGIYHNIASMDMVEKLVWPKKNKELEVNSIVRIHFSLGSEIERANWDNKENRTSENQIVVSELDYYHTKRNNLVLRRMNLVVDQRKGARSVFSFYYFSVFFICCATLGFREARKVEWLGGKARPPQYHITSGPNMPCASLAEPSGGQPGQCPPSLRQFMRI